MKNNWLRVVSLVVAGIVATGITACGKQANGDKIVITLDGGGDTANFNSTPSMTVSETNPFPYNTLEKLLKEWEELNPEYTVKLRRTSYGGDRSTLEPLLKARNAPDIIYQNATVLSLDLGKGYYVSMTDYLEEPNPYNNNKPWKEVYDSAERAGTVAEDGEFYYINMERYAAGIIYNKTMFEENNIKVPGNYTEFMQAQEKLYEIDGVTPYLSIYPWYDIVLETNLLSQYIEDLDLNEDRNINQEELVRGYTKGLWSMDSSSDADYTAGKKTAYEVYLDLVTEIHKYEPVGSSGYDPTTEFIMGKVGMIEATSEAMRKIYYDTEKGFDVGVIGYPQVEYGSYANDNYRGAGYGVRRGAAGTATSWWVTNSAEKNGTVEACVDLLMFLTAPENNNRMIGDLQGAIPLDPQAQVSDYLQPLVDQYYQDLQNPELYAWGGLCSWQILGLEYTSYYTSQRSLLLSKKNADTLEIPDINKRQTLANLARQSAVVIEELREEYQYDESLW